MSARLLQPCTSRLQRPAPHLVCRAEHVAATSSTDSRQRREQPSRRCALLLLPAAAAVAVWPRGAFAEQLAAETPAATVAATEELTHEVAPAAAVDLDVARWPMWVDRNFSFSYPKVRPMHSHAPPTFGFVAGQAMPCFQHGNGCNCCHC